LFLFCVPSTFHNSCIPIVTIVNLTSKSSTLEALSKLKPSNESIHPNLPLVYFFGNLVILFFVPYTFHYSCIPIVTIAILISTFSTLEAPSKPKPTMKVFSSFVFP
jgi:hypothetical protein